MRAALGPGIAAVAEIDKQRDRQMRKRLCNGENQIAVATNRRYGLPRKNLTVRSRWEPFSKNNFRAAGSL